MSPEERKVYMRDYMRVRRAAIKNGEIPGGKVLQESSDFPGEYEGDYTEVSPLPTWVVWSILGGIGVLVIGLIIATVVSDIRESKAVKPDSTEDTQREYSPVNVPIGRTIPTPNLGQYGS